MSAEILFYFVYTEREKNMKIVSYTKIKVGGDLLSALLAAYKGPNSKGTKLSYERHSCTIRLKCTVDENCVPV